MGPHTFTLAEERTCNCGIAESCTSNYRVQLDIEKPLQLKAETLYTPVWQINLQQTSMNRQLKLIIGYFMESRALQQYNLLRTFVHTCSKNWSMINMTHSRTGQAYAVFFFFRCCCVCHTEIFKTSLGGAYHSKACVSANNPKLALILHGTSEEGLNFVLVKTSRLHSCHIRTSHPLRWLSG